VKDQTIVITGAASGIGRAVAVGAAKMGAKLALLDLDAAGVAAIEAEAIEQGAQAALGLQCDVRDEAQVQAAFAAIDSTLGLVTALFANAGIEVNTRAHEMTLDDWHRVLEVNLTGVFLSCKYALVPMLAQGGGAIVCTSSPSSFVGFAGGGNGAYGASKGGISAFVRSLSLDYAGDGIRVNAIVPGSTDTPMLLIGAKPGEEEQTHDEIVRAAREQIPLQRLAAPAEIAEAVLWLLGPLSSYVTGSHLVCDGGLLAKGANTF
jgi:NAD(P)-dependent dehydrogenase (short-subunit alcohol dehydrogenase family)